MCKNDPKTHLVSTDLSDAGVALLQPVGVWFGSSLQFSHVCWTHRMVRACSYGDDRVSREQASLCTHISSPCLLSIKWEPIEQSKLLNPVQCEEGAFVVGTSGSHITGFRYREEWRIELIIPNNKDNFWFWNSYTSIYTLKTEEVIISQGMQVDLVAEKGKEMDPP